MRALILLHRWFGVAFSLLVATWFASGIVMHFVPFPALAESERFAGLAPIEVARLAIGPAEALHPSGVEDARRVRLIQRVDGPVYLIEDPTRIVARSAVDNSNAEIHSRDLALAIARDYARRRGANASAETSSGPISYDQWTIPGNYYRYRPLYRVALNDAPGTELYVSSVTGEVVLETTRRRRGWNYIGSIAHWIYPTALRGHTDAWRLLLWWLSFLTFVGAGLGAVIGPLKTKAEEARWATPYRGWHALHHWLGLGCGLFVLTWIFSGWLSLDDGLLFSTGRPNAVETAALAEPAAWNALRADNVQSLSIADREVEWFPFGGSIYRRERIGIDRQELFVASTSDDMSSVRREFLRTDAIDAAARRLAPSCRTGVIGPNDSYPVVSRMPGAPVFRVICGADWYEIDGSNGALLEKLDPSRRVYRWLYTGLHTFDFPILAAHPQVRATAIIGLCACGLLFSLTAVVIAWRRVRSCLPRPKWFLNR